MDQSVEQRIKATTELMWAVDQEISDREYYGCSLSYPHMTDTQLADVSKRCEKLIQELNAQANAQRQA